MAVATDQGSSSAMSDDADSIGTGTYAPRLTRASHPARDQAANLRAAATCVIPSLLAASPAVSTEGLSRRSRLSCWREVALSPDGFMDYILSEQAILRMTLLRLKRSATAFRSNGVRPMWLTGARGGYVQGSCHLAPGATNDRTQPIADIRLATQTSRSSLKEQIGIAPQMAAPSRFEPKRRSDSSPQICPRESRPCRSFGAWGNRLLMPGNGSRPHWLGAR